MTVFVRYQEDGSVAIRSPYDEAFLADFKRSIPWRHRQWDAEQKHWWVDWRFAKDAELLCEDWFDDVTVVLFERPVPPPPPPPPPQNHGPWETLYLIPTAPARIVDTVYRELMRMHHPDKGGNVLLCQRINAAYAALTKREKR
jgi:hypothetical protein